MEKTASMFAILLCAGILLTYPENSFAQSVCNQNELSPHPTRCDMYLQCDNNRTIERNCSVGTVFNEKLNRCDYPGNVDRCAGFQYFCERVTCPASTTCRIAPKSNFGYVCDLVSNKCLPNPCSIGQICSLDSSSALGYTCATTNACSSNPCVRGTCQVFGQSYRCTCPAGYTGAQCQFTTSPCQSNPCLRGTCSSSGTSFTCTCPAGYTGTRCEQGPTNRNCLPNPCVHGNCVETVTSYRCDCTGTNFTGPNCDRPALRSKCAAFPCPSDVPRFNYPAWNDTACQSYYNCEYGVLEYKTCPTGFQFDVIAGACKEQTNTDLLVVCSNFRQAK